MDFVCRAVRPINSRLTPRKLQSTRLFSSTGLLSWKSHTSALEARHANVPTYPHGPSQWFKQSNKGLFGQQSIRFGNNVGEESKFKTRRAWHPNVISRRLQSQILGRFLRVKLTTRVLRTIDKAGGLDQYLLGSKQARIKDLGMEGWKMRCELLASPAYQERLAKEQQMVQSAFQVQQSELEQQAKLERRSRRPEAVVSAAA